MSEHKTPTPSPRYRQVVVGLVLAALGWASIYYSVRFHLVLPQNFAIRILGLLLVAVGIIVRVMAFKEIRCTHRIDKLVSSGIYGRVRNPVYLAFLLIIAGFTVLSSAYLAYPWLLLSALVLVWMAKKEEADLEKAFGNDFMLYKKMSPGSFRN